MLGWLLACLLGTVAPATSGATDLTDVAAREKLRRAARSSKTFTENDLMKVHTQAPVTAAPPADASLPVAVAPPADADDDTEAVADAEEGDREERASAWRTTLREARDEASRLAKDVDQLRQELSDVRGGLYGSGRASQSDRLAKLSQQLGKAEERVGVLEDGGRQRGYSQ